RSVRDNEFSLLSQPAFSQTPGGIPPAPSGVLAESLSGSSVRISWADAPNETSYQIFESSSASPGSGTLIATLSANATLFVRSGLSPLTTYYYFLKAVNLYGASPFSSGALAVTLVSNQASLVDFEPLMGWPSCAPGSSWNQSISWSANGWSFKDMGFTGNSPSFPYYRGSQGVIGKNPTSWMQTLVTNPTAVECYLSCSAYGPGLPDWTISLQTAPVGNSNAWTTHAVFGNTSADMPAKAPAFNYKCVSNLGLPNGIYYLRFYKDLTSGNPNAYIDDIRIVASGQNITGPELIPSLTSLTEQLRGYPPRVPLATHPENVAARKKITSWLDTYASTYAQAYNLNDSDPSTYDEFGSNEICGWYRTRVQKVVDELAVTHPIGDEVAVWKMYSSGFIVRTATTTFAIDLIEGPNRNNMGAGKSTEFQNIAYGMSHAQLNALVDQIDVFFVSHSHHDHAGLVILTNALSKGKIVVGGTNHIVSDPDSAGETVTSMYPLYAGCLPYGKITDPYLNGAVGRNPAGEAATYTIGKLKVRIHYGIQRGTPGLSVRCYSYHITTPENFSVMSTADQKDVAGGQTASQASNDSVIPWLALLGGDGAHLDLYLGATTVFAPVFLDSLFAAFSNARN
ncbi:MAG: fibronectin type III domain-containing protein, partial [Spirochaetia bacterium]|nr:fibronectin type III domain-containing protein [Spirochaetia bacterium]